MLARCDQRHTLFLQGTGSRFFTLLSRKLEQIGVKTSKIHLCAGDVIFWRGGNAISYRGSRQKWGAFLAQYIIENGVSDIVLMSDSRPYHAVATDIAKAMKVNVFVFENGYVRPQWITMEAGGVNGRSGFPSRPEEIRRLAHIASRSKVTYPPVSKPRSKWLYFGDTVFHGANFLFGWLYPNYERFRNVSPVTEAVGWIRRLVARPGKLRRSRQRLEKLLESGDDFFFFPLQLEHDYQLKVDSPFNTLEQAYDTVISSFARYASADARLLVKNHPLDNNIINREADVARVARLHGVEDRVVFVEVGHNPTILQNAQGMVTINSTMGTSALHHGVPICVLGDAVYNVRGLAHENGLDSFWTEPLAIDETFRDEFLQALVCYCQIKGHFSERNARSGVFDHCIAKLLATPYNAPCKIADNAVVDTQGTMSDPENTFQPG